tara:strand:+ start:705 stop:962 length:258 start_codon:yes stop_codon:yes gene_type:complete
MRGRAHNRAQRQRAKARAHHLIANVLRHRADNPADRWQVSAEQVQRLERMYAVDRAHGRPAVRAEHRQERQAAADERQQVAEIGV